MRRFIVTWPKEISVTKSRLRRLATSALLTCALFKNRVAARADELTRMANTAFVLTLLDMATTRLSIAHNNGVEPNPIARAFVRSDAGALGYAILVTAFERVIFRKHPRAFIAIDGIEAYTAVHNYASRLHQLNVTHAAEQAQTTWPGAAETSKPKAK